MKATDGRIDQPLTPVATEGALMLCDPTPPRLSDFDWQIFQLLVPADHFLRKVLDVIPWDDFHEILAPSYTRDQGRPAESPVLMLKLEYLRYHHNLSDREVIRRAQTDVAFRYFLQIGVHGWLPDPSSLCIFRGRLGTGGFRKVFRQVVHTAREHGVVKDRLRIKDATHVIGNVAVPTALALVAQTRDKLLAAAEPFAPLLVEGERVNTEAGDKTRSTTDPDVRRAKHGDWYDGYSVDLSMDADSEIITEVNVLPANGDEAADAVELIRQEEAAHGNDIQALSIDGAGFNGPVLRELQDPEDLDVDTYVPPGKQPETKIFTPDDFRQDAGPPAVICPAGQTSHYRQRDRRDHGWIYRFQRSQCDHCPLLAKCMTQPPQGTFGKTIRKNDYEAEYRQARRKATTAEYAEIRREHPKVERKLGEVMNRHGGRRARYRGRWKVLIQELMSCTATNVKRLVRLLSAPDRAPVHET